MSRALRRRMANGLAVMVIVAVAVIVGGLAAGYRPVVIQTGSMGDTAPPGSLVIAAPQRGDTVDVGDIVVMRRPGATPVTHRVIEVEGSDTATFAITQGDANESPDAAPYPLGAADELVARWVVPGLGGHLETVFQPGVSLAILGLAVVWVAVATLRRIWAGPDGETETEVVPRTEVEPTATQRRRRLISMAAVPLLGLMTVGVAWALFQSSESVASNQFGTAECFDPQLASVQNGETIHAVDGAVEAPITAVDPAEAFVMASVRSDATDPADSTATVSLRGDGAAVVIERSTDAGVAPPVTVAWSVVHYSCGVSVQHGSATGTGTDQLDVAIADVDPASSFALVTVAGDATATDFGASHLTTAEITSNTNLRISTDAATVLPASHTATWQVVTFDDPGDVDVQRTSTSLATGVGSTTITLPTPVDPQTTFLLASVTTASTGADIGERTVRAHLVDANTVGIDRGVSGDPVTVHLRTITLRDGSSVRHGTVDFATGQPARTIDIEPTDPSRSTAISTVAIPGPAAGGSTDHVADDVIGEASATFAVTAATEVTAQRGPTASNASFGWQVIEWAGPSWWDPAYQFRQRIDVDTGATAAPGEYSVPLTLDHAALVTTGLAAASSGDDLRVARWDGTAWTELDRILDDGSAWDLVDTTIWFRTTDPIAADETATYWLYYGNDTPPAPLADPENVWLLSEDFESGTLGDFEDRTGGTGWYEADPWTRRIPLTIGSGQTGSDLTDFPVFVALTDPDLAASAQADGSDLRFVAADGVTPLAHEIETWDAVAGSLEAWVRLPLVSSGSSTSFWLVYGSADAPAQQDVRASWPEEIMSAWHLHRDPAGPAPQLDDSSSNNHDGVNRGAMDAADLVNGAAGGALDFDGVDDHLQADSFDLGGTGELTVSALVQPDAGAARPGRIVTKSDGTTTIAELTITENGALRGTLALDGTPVSVDSADGAVTTAAWQLVAMVWDGVTLRLAVDGVQVASTPAAGAIDADASLPVTIGATAGGDEAFDGSIDEVRIARVARTAAWLGAAGKNIDDPGGFVTAGAAERGTWFDQGAWGARKPIGIDPAITDADLTDVAVPITVVDAQLQASANADGSDLVFTAADGVTRLDHVVEAYDGGTGSLTAWVLVPDLSATTATELYLYYANPTATDQTDGAAVFGPTTDLTLLGTS